MPGAGAGAGWTYTCSNNTWKLHQASKNILQLQAPMNPPINWWKQLGKILCLFFAGEDCFILIEMIWMKIVRHTKFNFLGICEYFFSKQPGFHEARHLSLNHPSLTCWYSYHQCLISPISSKFPFHWPQFPKLFTGRQQTTLRKIIHSKVIMGAVVERIRTLQRYPCFKEEFNLKGILWGGLRLRTLRWEKNPELSRWAPTWVIKGGRTFSCSNRDEREDCWLRRRTKWAHTKEYGWAIGPGNDPLWWPARKQDLDPTTTNWILQTTKMCKEKDPFLETEVMYAA